MRTDDVCCTSVASQPRSVAVKHRRLWICGPRFESWRGYKYWKATPPVLMYAPTLYFSPGVAVVSDPQLLDEPSVRFIAGRESFFIPRRAIDCVLGRDLRTILGERRRYAHPYGDGLTLQVNEEWHVWRDGGAYHFIRQDAPLDGFSIPDIFVRAYAYAND